MKQQYEYPCAGCGKVYFGNPSYEPWACEECLEIDADEEVNDEA